MRWSKSGRVRAWKKKRKWFVVLNLCAWASVICHAIYNPQKRLTLSNARHWHTPPYMTGSKHTPRHSFILRLKTLPYGDEPQIFVWIFNFILSVSVWVGRFWRSAHLRVCLQMCVCVFDVKRRPLCGVVRFANVKLQLRRYTRSLCSCGLYMDNLIQPKRT